MKIIDFSWLCNGINYTYSIRIEKKDDNYILKFLSSNNDIIESFEGSEQECTDGILNKLRYFHVEPKIIVINDVNPKFIGFENLIGALKNIKSY